MCSITRVWDRRVRPVQAPVRVCPVFGDPQAVRRVAQRVAGSADEMRVDAHRAAEAAGVVWVAVRAGRYREQLAESVALAGRAASELDELDRALVAHADAVERRLEQIAAAERWLRDRAEDALDAVADAERSLERRALDWVDAARGLGWPG